MTQKINCRLRQIKRSYRCVNGNGTYITTAKPSKSPGSRDGSVSDNTDALPPPLPNPSREVVLEGVSCISDTIDPVLKTGQKIKFDKVY
jgi:hypothetical protein